MAADEQTKAASMRQIGIPTELADEVADFISRNPWLGLRSASQFAADACRKSLFEYEAQVAAFEASKQRKNSKK